MDFTIKQIGSHGGCKAEIIELTIESGSIIIKEQISNNNGDIPQELIDNVGDILYEMEQHNSK